MMRQCRGVLIVLRPRVPGKDAARDLGVGKRDIWIIFDKDLKSFELGNLLPSATTSYLTLVNI